MFDILSPIIYLKDFNFISRLCLNMGFEIFEVLRYLLFFTKKENPCEAWEIIKKNEHIPFFIDWWMWKRDHEVTMDQI